MQQTIDKLLLFLDRAFILCLFSIGLWLHKNSLWMITSDLKLYGRKSAAEGEGNVVVSL